MGVATAAVLYTAASAPSRPSPEAPRSLVRPFLVRAGSDREEVQLSPDDLSWRSPVHGVPVHLRFSWLACNMKGKDCSTVPALHTRMISPPQELRIVTLRGVVTGTNLYGSRSVASSNFYYDMAGLPFDDRGFLRLHPQYDAHQLRARFGLDSGQNGAGQTIVITDFGRAKGLRAAVDHFNAHFGLPRTCRTEASRSCFQLVISYAGRRPAGVDRREQSEAAADVEWVHAIAPKAKVIFVQFSHAATLLDKIGNLGLAGQASVVSDSWGDPGSGYHAFARDVVFPHLLSGCHLPHLVCVQSSGDEGAPGDTPSNSPYVLAVGGTKFASADGEARAEVPWPDSGSGVTDTPLPRPAWQRISAGCSRVAGAFTCARRAVPDVSALAASVPVFTPTREGWIYFRGTSLSAPLWAALIGLADQELRKHGQPPVGIDELHRVLYRGDVADGLDDISPRGWDWKTGLGSPKAGIVDVLAKAIEHDRASGTRAAGVGSHA